MLTSFSDLERIARKKGGVVRVLVAAAHDAHTLQGVNEACGKGMIEPVLIGNGAKIREIIDAGGLGISGAEIIETADDVQSAKKAAQLAASGYGNVLMKGRLQTADLLREVVNKELGLLTGEIMSHAGLFQIPGYHKLMILTDGGMVISPNAEQKRQILRNAVSVFAALGVTNPKAAVLCAAEVENPKIPATVDAALLKKQNAEGIIRDCVVEGPISFDLMYDKESAKIKGYESPVAGDADILLMPDMTAGNLVAKTFMCAAKAMMAGLVVGAKVPIVLVSRGAAAEEKYWSLVFAASLAQ
ncbi:MAG: phosphate butyryltransferase [Treponema sp.]|jgi:phosphate butyryltransferase|nr:phosphate butyryltransferase [Treponema sp.]